MSSLGDLLHSLEGHHGSASVVMRVFNRNESGLRIERTLWPDSRLDRVPIHHPILASNRMRERAADHRHPCHLEIEHVTALFDDDFLARLCMKPHSNLIAHCA